MALRSDIELCRVVAAIGIVWFHSGYPVARDIAYGGLVTFLVFSSSFSVSSSRAYSVLQRAERLLIPCALWSVPYALSNLYFTGQIFREDAPLLSMVLGTPSIHLWYLTFVFIALIVFDQLKRWVSIGTLGVLSMIAAIALLGSSPVWRDVSLPSPAGQYLHALPAFLIGIYAGTWRQTAPRSYAYAFGALLIGVVCALVVINQPGVGTTYAAGLLLALPILFRNSKIPASRLIASSGRSPSGCT